ncbi:MAG: hypothetical protein JF615_01990, partial [Asticcacaulis sp.]|nr:hypothetical protein [Asticcacaulis sp.]
MPPTKPLELVRADLEQKLKKLDRPLIVVIDDIDRLEADQIRTVFRHVKANADLPRLTYLLLFQPTVVEAALNPVAAGDGRGYLEKIIQASFDLPAVEISRVHKALFAALDLALAGNLTPRDGFDALRWGNLFHGGLKLFIQNLRDVHR